MTLFAQFQIDVGAILDFGQTVMGHRRMVSILGGKVSGAIGSGKILPGTDWQWVQPDGSVVIDAHYAIELNAGEMIEVESRGTRYVGTDGHVVFRTAIRLLTSANRPEINQRLFTAIGTRTPDQVLLDIYPNR